LELSNIDPKITAYYVQADTKVWEFQQVFGHLKNKKQKPNSTPIVPATWRLR
jgi:hypothetical protein